MDQQTQQQLLSMDQIISELERLMGVNQRLMNTMAVNQALIVTTIRSLMSRMNQINLQPQITNKQPSTMNHYTISTEGIEPSLPLHQQPEQPPQPLPLLSQQQPTVICPPDQLQQQNLMVLNRWPVYRQLQHEQQSMSFLQQQQRLASKSQNLTEQSMNDNPGAGMPSSSLLDKKLSSMHIRSNCVAETVNNAKERAQQKSSIVPGGTGVGNKVNSGGGGGGNSFWNLDLIKINLKDMSLKELVDLKTRIENELGDIRRMMSCLEISRKGGKVINGESKNISKTCGEEAHSVMDNNIDLDAENLQKGDDSPIAAGLKGTGEKVELHVEGKVENKDADENHDDVTDVERERGKDDIDEALEADSVRDDVDAHVEVDDNGDAELNEYVMV